MNFKNLVVKLSTVVLFAYISTAQTFAANIDRKFTYKIRPLDVLSMTVFQEPDMTTLAKVSSTGNIVLPLISSVQVSGMTLHDAQQLIKELYEKDYLVNAEVNLFIQEYSKQRVYVIGQVNRPGEVEFPPEETMTLSKAIASAMGPTRLASVRSIKIKRKMPDGKVQVFDVDFRAIMSDEDSYDIPLYDGDTIDVPESII